MKKINFCFVLLLATLCMPCCNKEESVRPQSGIVRDGRECSCHMSCWVDDDHFAITLNNQSELSLFCQWLNDLAFRGHHIRISNSDVSPTYLSPKHEERIDTKDEEEFNRWMAKMLENGYIVYYYYDKDTGIIHGIATKE